MRRTQQFGVIGLGRFGARVATGLYERGVEVIAVDSDPARVDAVKNAVTTAVALDATNREALEALALHDLDAVIVGIGRDIEASILVTALLQELGCRLIVARAGNDLHADILSRVGATRVVYPEDDVADRVVRLLTSPHVVDLVELEGDIEFAIVEVPRSFVGRSLRELELRNRYGLTVVAVRRAEEPDGASTVLVPGPDDQFTRGDLIYVVGDEQSIARIEQLG